MRSLIPWRSGTFYVIIASSLMGVMGISLISPVLPELRPVFGVSDTQVGLVITAYTLPGIFLTPFIGLLADRIGRKRVLVPLLFTFGVGGAGIAFTTSFPIVLGLRFLQGIGASALVMLAITLIGDIYEGRTRRTLIGINSSMMSTGAAFYPLIGGAMAVLFWQLPFLMYVVGVAVGLLAVFVVEEPDTGDGMRALPYMRKMARAARSPQAIAVFVAIFGVFFFFFGAVITTMPLLLSDEFGLDSGEIGIVLGVVAVASGIVASQYGWVSEWRTAPQLVAIGFTLYGVSLFGVWLAPSVELVGASLLIFGLGFGIVMPSIETTIVTLVAEDLRAGMMGLRTSMIRVGQTIGPALFTFSAEAFFVETVDGYYTLILLTSAVLLVSGSAAYLGLRE